MFLIATSECREDAPGIQWVEVKDTKKSPTAHLTHPCSTWQHILLDLNMWEALTLNNSGLSWLCGWRLLFRQNNQGRPLSRELPFEYRLAWGKGKHLEWRISSTGSMVMCVGDVPVLCSGNSRDLSTVSKGERCHSVAHRYSGVQCRLWIFFWYLN